MSGSQFFHEQEHIRIILANEPRLLREMLKRVFLKRLDLEVVAEVSNLSHLSEIIDRTRPQWVVVTLLPNGGLPGYAHGLPALYPRVGIVAVAGDGSRVKVKSGDAFERDLEGISLDDLLAILGSSLPLTAEDFLQRANIDLIGEDPDRGNGRSHE
ncbi:MAG TPA: hypothetical protein VE136_01510 [Anaerolineales bacterium]|nr:hypothetical protein [Anaerolineales bacterium]